MDFVTLALVGLGCLAAGALAARALFPRRSGIYRRQRPARGLTVDLVAWEQIPARFEQIEHQIARLADRSGKSGETAADAAAQAAADRQLREQLTALRLLLHNLLSSFRTCLQEARTDFLTGLANRRAFDEALGQQVAIADRYHTPCAVVLIDLDHFKEINDSYGHAAGDAALRRLSEIVQAGVRTSDLVGRYGGEEFALLLPQTSVAGAAVIAERIRDRVAAAEIQGPGGLFEMHLSAGVAEFCEGDAPAELMERADRALYRAKAAGRNRIILDQGGRLIEVTPEWLATVGPIQMGELEQRS